jgi:hypothetical protein
MIKLPKAKIKRFGADEVTFEIEPHQVRWLSDYKDKTLTIEVKEYKSSRTLRQNSLLWALISEMDIAQNGRATADGEMEIYCAIIRNARIKTLTYEMTSAAYEHTVKQGIFRHIEVLDHDEYYDRMTVRCYLGTSTFDTKEMTDFIESALDYAAKLGINLMEYKELKA